MHSTVASDPTAPTLRADPDSIVHLYRALLQIRRTSGALQVGSMILVDADPSLVVWERRLENERVVIAINMTDTPVSFEPPHSDECWTVALDSSTSGREGSRPGGYSGTIAEQSGVILVPAGS